MIALSKVGSAMFQGLGSGVSGNLLGIVTFVNVREQPLWDDTRGNIQGLPRVPKSLKYV